MITQQEFKRVADLINQAAKISDIVGSRVKLKRSGKSHKGLCPFHVEKTASFYVTDYYSKRGKGYFKCYGCGEAGDVIDFVEKHDNLSRLSALRQLASRYGIAIQEQIEQDQSLTQADASVIASCNEQMEQYYLDRLLEDKSVKRFLWKQRGIKSIEEIKRHGIGYCPKEWVEDSRPLQLVFNTATNEQMQSWGISNKIGKPFFGGRITFAIRNELGQVVGFGGRAHNTKSKAKYINTPETTLFTKSRELYGFDLVKSHLQSLGECTFVEGYTDVISTQRLGECTVAACGTSITEFHAERVSKYCKEVNIMLDPDKAGLKATSRAIPKFWKYAISPTPLLCDPELGDADDIYKSAENIEQAREKIVSYTAIQFMLMMGATLEESKEDSVERILEAIGECPHPLFRDKLIQELAVRSGFSRQALIDQFNKYRRKVWYG